MQLIEDIKLMVLLTQETEINLPFTFRKNLNIFQNKICFKRAKWRFWSYSVYIFKKSRVYGLKRQLRFFSPCVHTAFAM